MLPFESFAPPHTCIWFSDSADHSPTPSRKVGWPTESPPSAQKFGTRGTKRLSFLGFRASLSKLPSPHTQTHAYAYRVYNSCVCRFQRSSVSSCTPPSTPPRISLAEGATHAALSTSHIKQCNLLTKIVHMSWLESSEQAEKARVQSWNGLLCLSSIWPSGWETACFCCNIAISWSEDCTNCFRRSHLMLWSANRSHRGFARADVCVVHKSDRKPRKPVFAILVKNTVRTTRVQYWKSQIFIPSISQPYFMRRFHFWSYFGHISPSDGEKNYLREPKFKTCVFNLSQDCRDPGFFWEQIRNLR